MFIDRSDGTYGLFLYSLDTDAVQRLWSFPGGQDLRPGGWTPDGLRYAYHDGSGGGRQRTWIVDAASGDRTELNLAHGRLSNDGTRVVGASGGLNTSWLCVAPAAGGNCTRITPKVHLYWGSYHRWSPDDQWILSTREEDEVPFLFDPDGLTDGRPAWVGEGAETWQRLAP
jgi:Tol biopolymer transport system component